MSKKQVIKSALDRKSIPQGVQYKTNILFATAHETTFALPGSPPPCGRGASLSPAYEMIGDEKWTQDSSRL
jgi:hypothetical protein